MVPNYTYCHVTPDLALTIGMAPVAVCARGLVRFDRR
jgi:hypothetical protein